jgi:hypothetical protein
MARQDESTNEDGDQGAAKKRKTNDGSAVEGEAAEEKASGDGDAGGKAVEETTEESKDLKTDEEKAKEAEEKKEETIEDGFWTKIPPSHAFLSTISVDKNEVEVSHLSPVCKNYFVAL